MCSPRGDPLVDMCSPRGGAFSYERPLVGDADDSSSPTGGHGLPREDNTLTLPIHVESTCTVVVDTANESGDQSFHFPYMYQPQSSSSAVENEKALQNRSF